MPAIIYVISGRFRHRRRRGWRAATFVSSSHRRWRRASTAGSVTCLSSKAGATQVLQNLFVPPDTPLLRDYPSGDKLKRSAGPHRDPALRGRAMPRSGHKRAETGLAPAS